MKVVDKLRELSDKIDDSIVYKQQVWDGRDDGQWDKFWSSYHALRDAQEAIDQWKEVESPQRLEMYGLLQALVVQQDALGHLQESVGHEPINIEKDYPDLNKIRIARHQLVGHPSQNIFASKSYKEGTRTHTTVGYSSDPNVVEYIISSGKGSIIYRLPLSESIVTQETILKSEIDSLLTKMSQEDNLHKSAFQAGSLQKMLHTSTYLASKAYSFERDPEYARISIDSLSKIYEGFKKEICSRYRVKNIDETIHISGLVGELGKIDKVLPRVKKMLLNRDETDNLDLDVYAESLNNSFRLLQKMAKEIDGEFNARDASET